MNFFEAFEELNKLYEGNKKDKNKQPDFFNYINSVQISFLRKLNEYKDGADKVAFCKEHLDFLNNFKETKVNTLEDENMKQRLLKEIESKIAETTRYLAVVNSKIGRHLPTEKEIANEFSKINKINGADTDVIYHFTRSYGSALGIIEKGLAFGHDSGKADPTTAHYISLTTNILNVPVRRVAHYTLGLILDKKNLVHEILSRKLNTKHTEYFDKNKAQIIAIGRNKKPYLEITPDMTYDKARGNFQIHVSNSGEVAIPPIIYSILKDKFLKDEFVSKNDPTKKREYAGKDPKNPNYPNFLRIANDQGAPLTYTKNGENLQNSRVTVDTISNDIASVIETNKGIQIDCTSDAGKALVKKIKAYFLKQTLFNEFEYRIYSSTAQSNLDITNSFLGIVVDLPVYKAFKSETEEEFLKEIKGKISKDEEELVNATKLWKYCKEKNLTIKYFDRNDVVVNDEDFLKAIDADLLYDKNLVSPEDAPFDISRKIRLHEELDNSEAIIVDNEGLGAFFSSVILDDLLNEVSDIV